MEEVCDMGKYIESTCFVGNLDMLCRKMETDYLQSLYRYIIIVAVTIILAF